MRRKVSDEKLREMVRARRTKGDAFRLDHNAYTARQDATREELAAMTRAEIFARFPEYTYDLS